MTDIHNFSIKSNCYGKSKNQKLSFNLNNKSIEEFKEENKDINQSEEDSFIINISNKKGKYFVNTKNNQNKSSSTFIRTKKDINSNKSLTKDETYFCFQDMNSNTKEEPNIINIVHPIKIEKKKVGKEKYEDKDEKEYLLTMYCFSIILLIYFPLVGIVFFFSWMIKKNKKAMIIIIVLSIILIIILSIFDYILFSK